MMTKIAIDPMTNKNILAKLMKKAKFKNFEKSIRLPLTKSERFLPIVGVSKNGSVFGFSLPKPTGFELASVSYKIFNDINSSPTKFYPFLIFYNGIRN